MAGASAPVTEGSARLAGRLAWAIWVLGAVLRVTQLVLAARMPTEGVPIAWGVGFLGIGAAVVFGVSQATVGAVIVARRPGNVIGWILVVSGLVQGLLGAGTSWASLEMATGAVGPAMLVSTLSSVGIQAVPLAVITTVLLIFPDGRLPDRRWAGVVALAVIGMLLRLVEVVFGPSDNFLMPSVANLYVAPDWLAPLARASYEQGLGYRVLQVAVILACVSLVQRYRRADRVTRLQLRWFVAASIALGLSALPFLYVNLFVPRTDRTVEWTIALLFLGYGLPSVAVLVAITRYRLYEIDRIVNRTVLYALLTAILAGIFTAGVALAQRVFVLVTNERSDAAIVLTTFVVATAYAPIRKWLEGLVDRRFKYERARFGSFRDETQRVLGIVLPERAGTRLCREAVAELEALGAALVDGEGSVVASAGAWPLVAAVRVPVPAPPLGEARLLVGPRRDGQPHDPVVVAELEELAGLVGTAMGLAAGRPNGPAPEPMTQTSAEPPAPGSTSTPSASTPSASAPSASVAGSAARPAGPPDASAAGSTP